MGKRTKGQIHRDAVNSIVYRACGILRASIVQMEHACLEMGYPDASYGKNTEEEAESLVRHLLEALADDSPSLAKQAIEEADDENQIDSHTLEVYSDSVASASMSIIRNAMGVENA